MGCIHIVATFTPLINLGNGLLSPQMTSALTYMSLMCGAMLVILGILLIIIYNDQTKHVLAQRIIVGTTLINGVLAVDYMPHNPFAWILMTITTTLSIAYFAHGINNKIKHNSLFNG